MQERVYWLAWSQISGIGPILLQRLEQHFGSLANAWQAHLSELARVEGFGGKTLDVIRNKRLQINPEEFFTKHQEENPNFWTPTDSEYPRLLLEISNPPPVLYYRGQVDIEENIGQKPLVAIVGTRTPTEYGIRWTRIISAALAKNNFTVVSGLAEGIDTETHAATLKAGGRTIAVVGTGVDVVYPLKNRELYQQVLHQGLVLSEYSAKTPPHRTHFPQRNRIIAGLSRAVLVMEAPTKSGALITANYANDFGRDVYALPGRVDDLPSQGCLRLISQGATPIVKELDELLKMLGAIPQLDSVVNPAPELPNLPAQLQQIMNAINNESLPLDLVIQKTGMGAADVSSGLLELELMGLVSQLPGMRYQRSYIKV